jgi:hypothetical protein
MNWENKTKMCQHLNNSEYTEATNLFLESIEIIDEQAIDMFISGIKLTKECLSKGIDKHKIIAEKIKDRQSESFKTALRMALYEELIINGGNK